MAPFNRWSCGLMIMENKSVVNKNVLLINLGWEQQSYIEQLFQLGCNIFAVNHLDYVQDNRIVDTLISDYFDIENIIEFAHINHIDAVIADQCDHAIYAAAVVSEVLSCQNISVEHALLTTNKLLQRERIKLQNPAIKQPDYALCLTPQQAKQFAIQVGYPIILKPVDSRGSFGVSKVCNDDEVMAAFVSALNNSPARQVLVEEFIIGTQITVDGYIDLKQGAQSLALACKVMVDEQTQVAIGISYPGNLPSLLYKQAMDNNIQVVNALGLKFGMTHAEYMIDRHDDIYLIEIANRGGGCFTSTDILHSVTGIDFANKLVTDCVGLENTIDYKQVAATSTDLLFFYIPIDGQLESVTYTDELTSLEGLVNYKVMINEGDYIDAVSNDANRHGFIIIHEKRNNNTDKKSQLITKILSAIQFTMADGRVTNPVVY